jgi:hypothetical protein
MLKELPSATCVGIEAHHFIADPITELSETPLRRLNVVSGKHLSVLSAR